ncbi:hypothetical protein CLIB1444_12S02960 [[Candida] jaroonii]|uniref:Uncharacterized protein n=1 Tax=[Candida] jaroonii TaxID=467808 RepID=A0ACA9YF20_9ASCO|nr:hypothetical protein CLIB1444_12S02960 [[Candida] jaroonii]
MEPDMCPVSYPRNSPSSPSVSYLSTKNLLSEGPLSKFCVKFCRISLAQGFFEDRLSVVSSRTKEVPSLLHNTCLVCLGCFASQLKVSCSEVPCQKLPMEVFFSKISCSRFPQLKAFSICPASQSKVSCSEVVLQGPTVKSFLSKISTPRSFVE